MVYCKTHAIKCCSIPDRFFQLNVYLPLTSLSCLSSARHVSLRAAISKFCLLSKRAIITVRRSAFGIKGPNIPRTKFEIVLLKCMLNYTMYYLYSKSIKTKVIFTITSINFMNEKMRILLSITSSFCTIPIFLKLILTETYEKYSIFLYTLNQKLISCTLLLLQYIIISIYKFLHQYKLLGFIEI